VACYIHLLPLKYHGNYYTRIVIFIFVPLGITTVQFWVLIFQL